MEPGHSNHNGKDGKWEFPVGVDFPVDARVVVKLFKVAEVGCPGAEVQTKYLNTKVVKVEVSLEKEDLFTKSSLLAAIERDCRIQKLSLED